MEPLLYIPFFGEIYKGYDSYYSYPKDGTISQLAQSIFNMSFDFYLCSYSSLIRASLTTVGVLACNFSLPILSLLGFCLAIRCLIEENVFGSRLAANQVSSLQKILTGKVEDIRREDVISILSNRVYYIMDKVNQDKFLISITSDQVLGNDVALAKSVEDFVIEVSNEDQLFTLFNRVLGSSTLVDVSDKKKEFLLKILSHSKCENIIAYILDTIEVNDGSLSNKLRFLTLAVPKVFKNEHTLVNGYTFWDMANTLLLRTHDMQFYKEGVTVLCILNMPVNGAFSAEASQALLHNITTQSQPLRMQINDRIIRTRLESKSPICMRTENRAGNRVLFHQMGNLLILLLESGAFEYEGMRDYVQNLIDLPFDEEEEIAVFELELANQRAVQLAMHGY